MTAIERLTRRDLYLLLSQLMRALRWRAMSMYDTEPDQFAACHIAGHTRCGRCSRCLECDGCGHETPDDQEAMSETAWAGYPLTWGDEG